jgi:hypothetical protein
MVVNLPSPWIFQFPGNAQGRAEALPLNSLRTSKHIVVVKERFIKFAYTGNYCEETVGPFK